MSDDDDFSDKGKKTNASPTHKPKDSQQIDVSPTGTVGRKPAGLNLGGGSAGRTTTQSFEQSKTEQTKDDRPIAEDTNDPEVNADMDAQGFRRMTMDKIKAEAHGNAEREDSGPQISQSDYAKAFRQARDRTRQIQNDRGHEQS